MKEIYAIGQGQVQKAIQDKTTEEIIEIHTILHCFAQYHMTFSCRHEDFFTIWKMIAGVNASDSFTYLIRQYKDGGYWLLLDDKKRIKEIYLSISEIDREAFYRSYVKQHEQRYTKGYELCIHEMLDIFGKAFEAAYQTDCVILIILSF